MSSSRKNNTTPNPDKAGGFDRQCVYAESKDLKKLKKLLKRRDESLSQWFRRKIREELADAYGP